MSPDPPLREATSWLSQQDLLPEQLGKRPLTPAQIVRRYLALSKCAFGEAVGPGARQDFLRRLIPFESRLAAQ